MAFRVTHVEASEIHLIGEDNTFKDEANILEAWEEVRGGRNVNLLIEVHDDQVFVLKPFSNKVNLPDQNKSIWASKIVVSAEILKGFDPTQDIWMPIRRQLKVLKKAERDIAKYDSISRKSKSSGRRNQALADMEDCRELIEALSGAGWDTDGLFVTFIPNRNAGAKLQTLDLYTNGCLYDAVRDEIQVATPEQAVNQKKVDARFAYRSAAAQRCAILQLLKTLEDITGEEPLNDYEIQEVTMSFAEALDARILDEEVAARCAEKRS